MSPTTESGSAASTLETLRTLRRNLLWLIGVPALVVAIAVSYGVGQTIVRDFGRMVSAGASGFSAEYVHALAEGHATEGARSSLVQAAQARVMQGTMQSFALLGPDGTNLYESESGVTSLFTAQELERAANGRLVSRLDGFGGDALIYIASPLQGAGTLSEGTVLVVRPAETVGSSVRVAVAAVFLTVLMGALITLALQLWVIRRAEREIADGQSALSTVEHRLAHSLANLESYSVGTLLALTQAVDAKDSYTARHSLHVADYARALAVAMGHEGLAVTVERAGLVHDIGKIGTPEAVLLKPSGLTGEEFDVVKRHSEDGASIVRSIPFLSDAVDAVRFHHERWDGAGYPQGLVGESIPLTARILTVVDAFDAMVTNRPYRKAVPVEHALKELEDYAGTQFDPECTAAFVLSVRSGAIPVASA